MVAIGSGEEVHKPFDICTSMDMCFPNSIFIDDLLTLSTAATDSPRRRQPLLPPLQNPFHHQIQSSSADISSHNLSPSPSADVTADYLSIPNNDEAAELEWLSQFVDNCFHDDFPTVGETMVVDSSVQRSDTSFTSKADHRRRLRAALGRSRVKAEPNGGSYAAGKGSGMRRCSHCASEKTPQWRRGPLGPKTLCNACGVRYKSGRLLPEYRPASSPTFVLRQHSNSHRKVLELRRQKELELMKHLGRGASPSPE